MNALADQHIAETCRIIERSAEIAGCADVADYTRRLPEGDAFIAWLRARRWLIPRDAKYLEVKP